MNGRLNYRRILGTLLLVLAVIMLILGETLLKHQLGPIATLLYWTACVCATFLAVLCAVLDLGHSLRHSRTEQRQMLEQALRDIEAERVRRQKTAPDRPPESR